jgi:hypothetical protein
MLTSYAVVVTEENTPAIIKHLADFDLNVTDDLDGVVEDYATVDQVPYAILHVSRIDEQKYAKFYVIGSGSFHRNFRQSGNEFYGPFLPIEEN